MISTKILFQIQIRFTPNFDFHLILISTFSTNFQFQDQFELHKASLLEDREKMEKEIQELKLAKTQNVQNKELSLKDLVKLTEEDIEKQKDLGRKLAKQLEKVPKDFIPR